MKIIALILCLAVTAQAKIGKPRPVEPKPPGKISGPSIGRFEREQRIVRDFMENVGWEEGSQFEETGLEMKDLLLSMIRKNSEAKKWLIEVNEAFASDEWKKLSQKEKREEIFQIKLYAKMSIQEVVLEGDDFQKN